MSTKTAKNKTAEAAAQPPAVDVLRDPSRPLQGAGLAAHGNTGLQELALHLIIEDEHQPRRADNPGFSRESLGELAATIRDRGVKSPISVREHPHDHGRFIINHGARRFRASKLAGRATIPAFVDNDYNEADQVIENLQRNELTPREIADFIGRELAKGKKKGDIAREIGKSSAFVSQHVTLLDLPEPVSRAFNNGRASDVTVINELVKAYRKNPDEVAIWLADDSQELTRGTVRLLRAYLDDKQGRSDGEAHRDQAAIGSADGEQDATGSDFQPARKEATPGPLRKAIVHVRHANRPGRLILNRRPPAEGWAWLMYEDEGREVAVDLSSVQLVALREG